MTNKMIHKIFEVEQLPLWPSDAIKIACPAIGIDPDSLKNVSMTNAGDTVRVITASKNSEAVVLIFCLRV